MTANITLTQRMLNKSEINANKTIQQFLLDDFGLSYTDDFFLVGQKYTVLGEYTDGEVVHVNFFRRSGRGDKMISIQKLKKYAEAGDRVNLSSGSEEESGLRIFISIHKPTEEVTNA